MKGEVIKATLIASATAIGCVAVLIYFSPFQQCVRERKVAGWPASECLRLATGADVAPPNNDPLGIRSGVAPTKPQVIPPPPPGFVVVPQRLPPDFSSKDLPPGFVIDPRPTAPKSD